MTLVQSWIDSLALLKPKNAQLFIMVTIKSIIETYKVMFWYWGWVIVLMVLCYILPIVFPVLEQGHMKGEAADLSLLLYQLLLFVTCLATRPSIMKKDCAYFRSQIYSFLILLIFRIILPKFLWPTGISPWYIFFFLFFLDSAKRPKDFLISMWNALKMIIYSYPLIVVMSVCFYVPVLIFYSFTFITPIMQNIIGALLLPIGVCTYANIYIKKLHDQFDLYFMRS